MKDNIEKRILIKINSELLREFRIFAINKGVRYQTLVNMAMRSFLRQHAEKEVAESQETTE